MRAFAAVFAREVFARRLVFPVALAAGFMPLVGSLSYGWSRPDAAEGRILVALVTAAAFTSAFALLFGGSVIAGETSEKRISFFFSRPISAASIWAGKVLAVLVLTFVPAVLALVPAFAASTSAARQGVLRLGGAPGAVVGFLFVTLFFIFGAHAVVTIARLRSPWTGLDLLLAPALVLLAVAFLRSLLRNGLFGSGSFDATFDLGPFLAGLAAVVLAALVAASCAQVAAGRTDARRSHGVFSVVLWGILATATAALGGYAWWVGSARATDLERIEGNVLAAPRGGWVNLDGPLAHRGARGTFLYDTTSRRSIRVRPGDTAFAATGARAAWVEERIGSFERGRKADVFVADLSSAKAVETGLTCSVWCRVALSPSGNRLGVLDEDTLAAYEISDPSSPRQLVALRAAVGCRTGAFFDEDHVRLFPRVSRAVRGDLAPADLEIEDVSLPSKKSLVTGRFERDALPYLRISADGRYLVGTQNKRLTLHDGQSGALVATLAEDLRAPQLRFLTGGRIAVAGIAGAQARLVFFEGEKGWGAPGRLVELGPAKRVVLGGEITPGRVALSLLPFEGNLPVSWRAAKLAIVDAATGAVSAGPAGLVPADRVSWWFSPTLPPAEAGSPASFLFLDARNRLVRLDAATGAQTVLLGRSK